MKIKKTKILFLLVALFLSQDSFAYALETQYPPIPSLPYQITEHSSLAQYIGYFFALAIIAAGILAVIVLSIGAIRLIISTGNPTSRKEATDMIKGSILGMVLVMASFMILRTINPSFIEPTQTSLPPVEGIYYFNGSEKQPAPMAEANTKNRPQGYDQILYDCSSGSDLFIWKFPNKNFEGVDSAFVETLACGSSTDIAGAGSFKMAFKSPGIYYFLGVGCSGYMSEANTSGGQLPELFKNKIKSIKIINNIENNIRYGVVFHSTNNHSDVGACSVPYFITDPKQEESCSNEIPGELYSSSAFFIWNGAAPETSGAGLDFYSEPWGKFLGARAGKYSLSQNAISAFWHGNAQNIKFSNYSASRPGAYKNIYQNFSQRPGSIFFNGSYIAILYNKDMYCQMFSKDVFNFKTTEFYATRNIPDYMYVIPTK